MENNNSNIAVDDDLDNNTNNANALPIDDFFPYYDMFFTKAAESSLEQEATFDALKQAKHARNNLQNELAQQQQKLRMVRKDIQEHKHRIHLVSTHWFYGTTVFQPQLWWRGGCPGKIERARWKLVGAEQSRLPIQNKIQDLQQQEPNVQTIIDQHLTKLDLSIVHASETQLAMKQRAILVNHPSNVYWLQLSRQNDELQEELSIFQAQATSLEQDFLSKLIQSQEQNQLAQHLLDQAWIHNKTHEQLLQKNPHPPIINVAQQCCLLLRNNHHPRRCSQTLVADGTKIIIVEHDDIGSAIKDLFHIRADGSIISTNFPCPGGCGFLVTWHETHCCHACSQQHQHNGLQGQEQGDGHHGKRCNRKLLSSQQGAEIKYQDNLTQRQVHATTMSEEDDSANRKFTDGRKHAKQAERTFQQALTDIPSSIQEHYPDICCQSSWNNRILFKEEHDPHGGWTFDSKMRAFHIRQEVERLKRWQTMLSQRIATTQTLLTQIRQDICKLRDKRQCLEATKHQEESRIFQELRGQQGAAAPVVSSKLRPTFAAAAAATTPTSPSPSAPTESGSNTVLSV